MSLNKITFRIITLSDRASKGVYEDLSGPKIQELALAFFAEKRMEVVFEASIIPDDPDALRSLLRTSKTSKDRIVFTTGGTGIGPRDFTPEVVREFIDKEIPGVMELIRVKYGMTKPNALVSRSVAGVMDRTLVFTLPGSVKAVSEYCTEIFPTLMHSLRMLEGSDDHS